MYYKIFLNIFYLLHLFIAVYNYWCYFNIFRAHYFLLPASSRVKRESWASSFSSFLRVKNGRKKGTKNGPNRFAAALFGRNSFTETKKIYWFTNSFCFDHKKRCDTERGKAITQAVSTRELNENSWTQPNLQGKSVFGWLYEGSFWLHSNSKIFFIIITTAWSLQYYRVAQYITVCAYIFCVSIPAIILAVFYTCIWDPKYVNEVSFIFIFQIQKNVWNMFHLKI